MSTLRKLLLAVALVTLSMSAWGATILEGPVTISGIVVATGDHEGWVIEVSSEEVVAVYGIGPEWFWESQGTARPEVGDFVSIMVYLVQFADGSTKYIATTVTMGDTTVVLRDAQTALPLWRTGGAALKAFALRYHGLACTTCSGNGDQDQLRLQDQDRLRDGSCVLE